MKKISTLIVLLLVVISTAAAQEKCGTSALKTERLQDSAIAQRVTEIENFTQNWIQNSSVTQREVVTLPIVVHVLYANATQNISEAQIQSQIDILNADFRKMNADFNTTPAAFQTVAADTEIEFCLASIDPEGNPTSGITRTEVDEDFDIENDYYDPEFGGHAPWDNTKYINVWLCDLLDASELLGFATAPGTADEDDGAVIAYNVWGNTGMLSAPNDLGRTATHEIGHYLNLDHVWGPSNGGCNEDDFVADTPPQDEPNYGCDNTFPLHDDCSPNGDGVMFSNFLDYGDDACLTMFTQGQKERMLAALNGPRAGLLSSNGCGLMSNTNEALEQAVQVAPNPASSVLNITNNFGATLQLDLYNLNGQLLLSTEMATFSTTKILNISDLVDGVYFLKITSEQLILTQKIIKSN